MAGCRGSCWVSSASAVAGGRPTGATQFRIQSDKCDRWARRTRIARGFSGFPALTAAQAPSVLFHEGRRKQFKKWGLQLEIENLRPRTRNTGAQNTRSSDLIACVDWLRATFKNVMTLQDIFDVFGLEISSFGLVDMVCMLALK